MTSPSEDADGVGGRPPSPAERAEPEDPRVVRTRNDVLSTALSVLVGQGSDAVTHPHLARESGYSRATLYKHWPTRADLFREALARLRDVGHHTPTGDLRTDLIGELVAFRTAIDEHGLDRALAVLVDLGTTRTDIGEVRERVVSDGERVVRGLLAPLSPGPRHDAVLLMLCGSVLYSALLHGRTPDDDVVAASVDLALAGLSAEEVADLTRR